MTADEAEKVVSDAKRVLGWRRERSAGFLNVSSSTIEKWASGKTKTLLPAIEERVLELRRKVERVKASRKGVA